MLVTTENHEHNINYRVMSPDDFYAVITLATDVHGEGYIDPQSITKWFNRGLLNNINASFVAYHNEVLVGFRLTFACDTWLIDQWCTPDLWEIPTDKVCYFKCNTVDENFRGYGIGSQLLKLSINAAKQQGALAGISHLWRESPENSAVNYFSKCGGELIKDHPDRWNELSQQGYCCPICEDDCHCTAAEMIIRF